MLASLQSGFAVTLSLQGPHEGSLSSTQNGLGACQWAGCQHTVRPGTFDVPHKRTDGRKGEMDGKETEKEVRTGENNVCHGRAIVGTTIMRFIIPFTPNIFM